MLVLVRGQNLNLKVETEFNDDPVQLGQQQWDMRVPGRFSQKPCSSVQNNLECSEVNNGF